MDVPQSLFDYTVQVRQLLQRYKVDVSRVRKRFAEFLMELLVDVGVAENLENGSPGGGPGSLSAGARHVHGIGEDCQIRQWLSHLSRKPGLFEWRRIDQVMENGASRWFNAEGDFFPDLRDRCADHLLVHQRH